jgi:hypothetical protein
MILATKDTVVTVMSSNMDSDGYTTMSHRDGYPTSSPISRPQCRSPSCPGNEDGVRRNPFDDNFLTTFHLTFLHGLDDKNVPTDAVLANKSKKTNSGVGTTNSDVGITNSGVGTAVMALFVNKDKNYEEPAKRGSPLLIFWHFWLKNRVVLRSEL